MQIITRKEAQAAGLKRYFTGVPCKNGHVAERGTKGCKCLPCDVIASTAYILANQERVKLRNAKHHEANKEAHKVRAAKWYKENRVELLAKEFERYKTTRPLKLTYAAEYRRINADKVAACNKRWRENNPAAASACMYRQTLKRKARTKHSTPEWSDKAVVVSIYTRRLEVEAMTGIKHHVDHIVPIAGKIVSGLNVHFNLQVIPATENLRKNNRFNQELQSLEYMDWLRNNVR